jgi:DNA-3-methyladenine glycosylase
VREDETGRREGRIVEVEAYGGPDDRASHARFDSTRRNRVMAGPPGVAYVYLVYGMYDCLNVVTGPEGAPSAVLIRAVEPLDGMARMREDRLAVSARRRAARTAAGAEAARARLERTPDHRLASGPGMVAAAFGVDTTWTGRDLCSPDAILRLERDPADPADTVSPHSVLTTARIGVAYAGPDWAGRPWRFAIAGHPSVSGRAAR